MNGENSANGTGASRGQMSLPALGVAFLMLTAATLVGLTAATGAIAGSDRQSLDRQAAVALSERLTATNAPLTARANVLEGERLDELDAARLRTRYGLSRDAAVRIRLDGRTLAQAGDPGNGRTVSRLVLVRNRTRRTLTPAFTGRRTVTLPRRSANLTLTLSPPANTTLPRVWANGRVVLRNASGLRGTYRLDVSPYETATLRFDAAGPLPKGSVTVTYYPERTRKAKLRVTVDG